MNSSDFVLGMTKKRLWSDKADRFVILSVAKNLSLFV